MIRIPTGANLTESYDISVLNKLNAIVLDPTPTPSNNSQLLNPLFDMAITSPAIDSTVKRWMKDGVDPKKIVIGIPTYGVLQRFKNYYEQGLEKPVNSTTERLTRKQVNWKFIILSTFSCVKNSSA